MEIKDPIRTENTLDFVFEGVETNIANTLRRVMISDVPTFTIDTVTIIENKGVLQDEMITHRLGLLPLRTNLSKEDEEKGLDGAERCELNFSLDVSYDEEKANPKNGYHTIYSGDVIFDSPVEMVYKDIIITKLGQGQQLKLKGIAVKGTGEEHSKWSPCCGTTYEKIGTKKNGSIYKFHIETTGSLSPEETFLKSIELTRNKLKNLEH